MHTTGAPPSRSHHRQLGLAQDHREHVLRLGHSLNTWIVQGARADTVGSWAGAELHKTRDHRPPCVAAPPQAREDPWWQAQDSGSGEVNDDASARGGRDSPRLTPEASQPGHNRCMVHADDMVQAPIRAGWAVVIGVLGAWLAAGFAGAVLGTLLTGATDDAYAAPLLLLGHVGVPALLGLLVATAATSLLRWWGPVLNERFPLRPWGWAFPVAMIAGGAAFADWSRLLAAGPALLAALIVTVAIITASEELTFRGLLLVAMRGRYREGVAAAMTVVIFAVVHVLVGGGLSNLGQGITTIVGGFLYYLTRRVSGGLLAPILVHATWNFTALSVLLGPGAAADTRAFETILVLALLVAVALAAWRPLTRPR